MAKDSEDGDPASKDAIFKKRMSYMILTGLVIGSVAFPYFEPYPDAADNFDTISDYEDACNQAAVSDPQWYIDNSCEDYVENEPWVVISCCLGLLLPVVGAVLYYRGVSPWGKLEGYWDGTKVISLGQNLGGGKGNGGPNSDFEGLGSLFGATNRPSGNVKTDLVQNQSSFNERMIEMRLNKARDLASSGLFSEAAYEAEMAGDLDLASKYRESSSELTEATGPSNLDQKEERYGAYLKVAMADGVLSPQEEELLREKREEYGISESRANEIMEQMGFNAIGEGMLDKYRFTKSRKLRAEGGMAEVYLANDKQIGKQVIWKQAAPSRVLSTEDANLALENEVDALKRLDHPRIPAYIDSGFTINEEGDRVLVLIMEHIEGGSLDDEMKLLIKMETSQPLERSLKIIVECCDALDYMADLDPPLYHRDIKPHNIIIEPERGAILIDFGLAKEVAAGSGKSLSGGAHTAGWSPPERERGETGPTTDVYSLGQLLWNMLTNESAGIFSESYKSERIIEQGHPNWLVNVVNNATVPDDPSKRIQSVAALRYMLENDGNPP